MTPDEPCNRDECGHSCWPDADGWTRDVKRRTDWGDIDGEGPCSCEHHETEAEKRAAWGDR